MRPYFTSFFNIADKITYTGVELRPHFLLTQFGLQGTALAAFRGPCMVPTGHLVDWEDRLVEDFIKAKEMVHFIGEFFGVSLREGVWIQRLLMAIIAEEMMNLNLGLKIKREGDDLFFEDFKLSVSIVTSSPVSLLLHTGLNLLSEGAPVKAKGLFELGFDDALCNLLVKNILMRFEKEFESVQWATCKVRPVLSG